MIWDEQGRAGYGLYDRALGVAYLSGLWRLSKGPPVTERAHRIRARPGMPAGFDAGCGVFRA